MYGEEPFPGIGVEDFILLMENGERLRMAVCQQSTYELMLQCWAMMPCDRPKFNTIHEYLLQASKVALTTPGEYIDIPTRSGLAETKLSTVNLNMRYGTAIEHHPSSETADSVTPSSREPIISDQDSYIRGSSFSGVNFTKTLSLKKVASAEGLLSHASCISEEDTLLEDIDDDVVI